LLFFFCGHELNHWRIGHDRDPFVGLNGPNIREGEREKDFTYLISAYLGLPIA